MEVSDFSRDAGIEFCMCVLVEVCVRMRIFGIGYCGEIRVGEDVFLLDAGGESGESGLDNVNYLSWGDSRVDQIDKLFETDTRA